MLFRPLSGGARRERHGVLAPTHVTAPLRLHRPHSPTQGDCSFSCRWPVSLARGGLQAGQVPPPWPRNRGGEETGEASSSLQSHLARPPPPRGTCPSLTCVLRQACAVAVALCHRDAMLGPNGPPVRGEGPCWCRGLALAECPLAGIAVPGAVHGLDTLPGNWV